MSLSRTLALLPISAGMALSASCYLVIAELCHETTSFAVLASAIIIGGLVCSIVAFSVASLASRYPTAPGIRAWTRKVYGEKISFTLTLMLLLLAGLFAGVENYVLGELLKIFSPDISLFWVTTVIFISVVTINLIGVDLSKKLQAILAYTLILVMAAIGLWGGISGNTLSHNTWMQQVSMSDLLEIPGLVGISIFLFMGFDWVAPLGSSKNDYMRAIPMAMILAIASLTLMYILFIYGMTYWIDSTQIKSIALPHAKFGFQLFGNFGFVIMVIVSLIALITTFNAGLLGASRITYALGREGLFPKFTTSISERSGTLRGGLLGFAAFAYLVSLIEIYFSLQTITLVVCAAMYCTIYASILLADIIEEKRQIQTQKKYFKNPIALPLRYVTFIFMVLSGILSLFSLDNYTWQIAFYYTATCLAAIFISEQLMRRKKLTIQTIQNIQTDS